MEFMINYRSLLFVFFFPFSGFIDVSVRIIVNLVFAIIGVIFPFSNWDNSFLSYRLTRLFVTNLSIASGFFDIEAVADTSMKSSGLETLDPFKSLL